MLGLHSFPIGGTYVSSLDRDGGLENPGLKKKAECHISAVHQTTQRQISPYGPKLVAAALSIPILQLPSISSKAHKLHVIIMGHSPSIETRRSRWIACHPLNFI